MRLDNSFYPLFDDLDRILDVGSTRESVAIIDLSEGKSIL